MALLASFLGYEKNLARQNEKIENPELTPSAKILSDIKRVGMQKMGIQLAKMHKKSLLMNPLSPKKLSNFKNDVQTSLIEKKRLETAYGPA